MTDRDKPSCPLKRRTAFLALAAALASLAGCGQKYPTLTFTSRDDSRTLKQPFALAAMARDEQGDYDLVLSSQGLEHLHPEAAGKPITPSDDAPVRQVLHFKIHWRPQAGASANNPAASNASVRWIVFGTPDGTGAAATDDVVEYQGTAFVKPNFGTDGYYLRIRKGELKRTRMDGDMVDALGPSDFEGKFFVKDDAYTVANVLKDLPAPAEVAAPARPTLPKAATQRSRPRR